ncbi:MAG: DNA topoisomerase I [Candidatus Aenigmarchaeota archaeon]|nr:DNA topoisomerase I [Candidatus Aenigmarchaeota archaeon]
MVHLIIAEKPTAAKKIADAILDNYTAKKATGGVSYFESPDGNTIVASAAGHIFGLEEEKKRPYPNFDLSWAPAFKKNSFTAKFHKVLMHLGKMSTETTIATDYDVEGEVIGYNIYRFLCGKSRATRMCFSTLTKPELKKAFDTRKNGVNLGLAEAGLTRHYLDFFYGVNISKALTGSIRTATNRYQLLSSGRVQGPTLALIVKRELEIEAFKPVPYWQINFQTSRNGKGEKFPETLTFEYETDKIWEKPEAEKIFSSCQGKNAVVDNIQTKKHKLNPPTPFNLTDLQSEAYRVFGYAPSRTQSIAQGLYLQGVISYPRTSSQKLPESIEYKPILEKLAKRYPLGKQLLGKDLKPNEGNKTDPAHPSIYPTGEEPEKLDKDAEKLYELIVHRFFAIFGQPAERMSMKVTALIDAYAFNCTGARTIAKNWLEMYPYAKLEEVELPSQEKGTVLIVDALNMLDKETQPPKRYNQASLIKELEKRNLGTKSTRAAIIQILYDRNYIEGQKIKATTLGVRLITTLEKFVPEIVSEELTVKLESEMEQIQEGTNKRENVLEEAKENLTSTFKKFRAHEKEIGQELSGSALETQEIQNKLGPCLKCDDGELKFIRMYNGSRFVGCTNYPNCKNAYPLPYNCAIEKTGKTCEKCNTPILKIIRKGHRPFTMCLDPNCETKKDWGAKKKEKPEDASPEGAVIPKAGETANKTKPKAVRKKKAPREKAGKTTKKRAPRKTKEE